MEGLEIPKRVHIIPLGYEEDRIVVPAIEYDADEAILLEPSTELDNID